MLFWRGIASEAIVSVDLLESALSARDQRIAELEASLRKTVPEETYTNLLKARAEVPEWCREFMGAIARDWDSYALDETAAHVVHEFADQLRACGIETT
jgi:hypothetical protein